MQTSNFDSLVQKFVFFWLTFCDDFYNQIILVKRERSHSMKQITNKQHLVHLLPDSHLVTSLPFIDQDIDNHIPKSKVSYLIASQQQKMNKDPLSYI